MRLIQRAVAALAVGGLALALTVSSSAAKPLADWDTSEIMKKINGKGKGAIDKAKKAVAAEKWDDAAKETESLKHGEELVKNKPAKGDKESWEKLAKAYGTSTAALVSAIEKKDKAAFDKSAKSIGGSCKTCHDAHK